MAETSPYYEAIRSKNHEVLFCYEPYDELVLLQMAQFDRMTLLSVEKAIRKDKSPDEVKKEQTEGATAHLSSEDLNSLSEWIKTVLGKKVNQLKVNDNAMGVFVRIFLGASTI